MDRCLILPPETKKEAVELRRPLLREERESSHMELLVSKQSWSSSSAACENFLDTRFRQNMVLGSHFFKNSSGVLDTLVK